MERLYTKSGGMLQAFTERSVICRACGKTALIEVEMLARAETHPECCGDVMELPSLWEFERLARKCAARMLATDAEEVAG